LKGGGEEGGGRGEEGWQGRGGGGGHRGRGGRRGGDTRGLVYLGGSYGDLDVSVGEDVWYEEEWKRCVRVCVRACVLASPRVCVCVV
jgi:hypothetical protein